MKNIDINIDINMVILENIDIDMDFLENIDIDIDKGILKNIDWNLAYRTGLGVVEVHCGGCHTIDMFVF